MHTSKFNLRNLRLGSLPNPQEVKYLPRFEVVEYLVKFMGKINDPYLNQFFLDFAPLRQLRMKLFSYLNGVINVPV